MRGLSTISKGINLRIFMFNVLSVVFYSAETRNEPPLILGLLQTLVNRWLGRTQGRTSNDTHDV